MRLSDISAMIFVQPVIPFVNGLFQESDLDPGYLVGRERISIRSWMVINPKYIWEWSIRGSGSHCLSAVGYRIFEVSQELALKIGWLELGNQLGTGNSSSTNPKYWKNNLVSQLFQCGKACREDNSSFWTWKSFAIFFLELSPRKTLHHPRWWPDFWGVCEKLSKISRPIQPPFARFYVDLLEGI